MIIDLSIILREAKIESGKKHHVSNIKQPHSLKFRINSSDGGPALYLQFTSKSSFQNYHYSLTQLQLKNILVKKLQKYFPFKIYLRKITI